jgi:hypothetical protein
MWVSAGFRREYETAQAVKLAIIDAALDACFRWQPVEPLQRSGLSFLAGPRASPRAHEARGNARGPEDEELEVRKMLSSGACASSSRKENRILKAQLSGRPRLSDAERGVLREIGHRLGRKVLADIATVARPDTIVGWYRQLVARKFDGSMVRQYPGRPRINHQGKGNVLLFPRATDRQRAGPVRCSERLGGLLRYYYREVA